MSLSIGVATCHWEDWARCVRTWTANVMLPRLLMVVEGKRVTDAYQEMFNRCRPGSIIGYIHDDVICNELDWDVRIMQEFTDPKVGLVGLGGALRHGSPDLYRSPYALPQLGRSGFMSNMREAEVHGMRFKGERDVAVVDGFAMFVRWEVIQKAGGWPLNSKIDYISYDYWLSCMARRLGYRIRLVGIECDHLGGKSTGLNKNLQVDFEGAHRAIYDEFRDVLPYEVA